MLSIYSRFPTLDVAGSSPVSRSILFNHLQLLLTVLLWPTLAFRKILNSLLTFVFNYFSRILLHIASFVNGAEMEQSSASDTRPGNP